MEKHLKRITAICIIAIFVVFVLYMLLSSSDCRMNLVSPVSQEALKSDPILPFLPSDVKKVEIESHWSSMAQTYQYEEGAGLDEIMGELTASTILGKGLLCDIAQDADDRDGGSGARYVFSLKNGDTVELVINIQTFDWEKPERTTFTLVRSVNGAEDYSFNHVYLFKGPVGRWWHRRW